MIRALTSDRNERRHGTTILAVAALGYGLVTVSATMTLDPYLSQTWDVRTFIQAAHRFIDGGTPFDLYARSRSGSLWPYAYPPLHALAVAVAIVIGRLVHALPEYVWARAPVIAGDIGIAFLIHAVVRRRCRDETLARSAALVWLFNPLLFLQTAAQGHFESEWLLFVLLAYDAVERGRPIAWLSAALAVAVSFKQVAILFVVPVWVFMFARTHGDRPLGKRIGTVLSSAAMIGLITAALCLPYVLHSPDFLYLNVTYLAGLPLQSQSWLVALAGPMRVLPSAGGASLAVPIVVAAAVSWIAVRRRWGLFRTGALIAIGFFLTATKVMGYYYVMLVPFLLVEASVHRRFDDAAIALVVMAWISVSPYFGPWASPSHWPLYAAMGTVNSLYFGWLFVRVASWRYDVTVGCDVAARSAAAGGSSTARRRLVLVSTGLFSSGVIAALLQPLAPHGGGPKEMPIVPAAMVPQVLAVLAGAIALEVVVLMIIRRGVTDARQTRAWVVPWIIVAAFTPLLFLIYTLTKDVTAAFERMLGG